MSTDADPTAQADRTNTAQLADLRRAFTAVPPSAAPRADCPPAGRIWEGVRGELAPPVLRQILHHVANCALCTEAWRLAEKLEHGSEENLEDGGEEPPGLPSPVPFGWFRRSGAAVAAAAAVVVLAVGLSLRDAGPGAPSAAFRAPGADEIELLSSGPLPREDFVLTWRGPEQAATYDLRVTLATDLMKPLARASGIETPEYRVPAAALAGLPPGAELVVRIEAVHPIEGRLDAATFSIIAR